jgi:hypothetical protein
MKTHIWLSVAAGLSVLGLGACVPTTMAPTVAARPGMGKSPVDFAADNSFCSAQANQQISVAKAQANNQVIAAALMTDPNTTSATLQTNTASLQQQLDIAYSACMYAKGESVPGYEVSEPLPQRRVTRPKPKPPTDDKSAFVEPPPAATPASSSGFTEPPPVAKP